ncbi:MAG: DUF89 family protein [Clostridia bacterium]|nr:DUF89 family protein [Clostridia bacterium]
MVKFLNSKCIKCLIEKYTSDIPTDDEEIKVKYIKRVLSIIASAEDSSSAPEVVEKITAAQGDILGVYPDYSAEKKYYNELILGVQDTIENNVLSSNDPFISAMKYSFAGNYIDFGTIYGVEQKQLIELLDNSQTLNVSAFETENLSRELKAVDTLVYLIDNCGEIVLDKIFIKTIKRLNPGINVTVITRGEPVLNDCTAEDAYAVGMGEVANIVSNGTAVAGTCLDRISAGAKAAIDGADLIISKGQGNFETLMGCGKNVYYLFLCKCEKFSDKFSVPKLSPMLLNEKRIKR